MVTMVKQQNTFSSTALAMHRDSHKISKLVVKPEIRIIHIAPPEIIKTDVANFRELVQRLTGKPTESSSSSNKKSVPRGHPRKLQQQPRSANLCKKVELRTGFCSSSELRERIFKGEEMMMMIPGSTGGYLGGFADLDGFMQELNQFPLFPNLDHPANSHMDALGVGEGTTQLA